MEKACTKCRAVKPLTAFAQDGRATDGTRSQCRSCAGVYNRAWNKANPERMKIAERLYRERHKERIQAKAREWRRAHPNEHAWEDQLAEWRRQNPDRVRLQKRAWRLANETKVRQQALRERTKHADKYRARVKRWRLDNPERHRAHNLARRARKANAQGVGYTTEALIAQRVAYHGGRCYYCKREAEAIDHRIPLARGGSHWPANLVPCCRSCNSSKNDRTEPEFLRWREEVVSKTP